ncbi:MAG: hypothetical protein F4X26_04680 [Chloroflexi bacterium]|nr:hypothetical protein [Chloroflexota bacterium]
MWPPAAAEALRARGHDVEAVAERDLRTASDAEILAAAQAEARVVVTQDVGDFRRLAAAEARAGRVYPPLILTDKRSWPRGTRRATGRLVRALDALLRSDMTIEGEHWLTPVD